MTQLSRMISDVVLEHWLDEEAGERCFDHDEGRMDLLQSFLRGRAGPGESEDVRAHLIECSRCRFIYARIRPLERSFLGDAVNYIAFDLETTGLYPKKGDRIIELGAVRFDEKGIEIDRYEKMCNPTVPISHHASKVNGIYDADVMDKPTSDVILREFLDFIGDPSEALLIAHNAQFDLGFLVNELAFHGMMKPHVRCCCTMESAAMLNWLGLGTYPISKQNRITLKDLYFCLYKKNSMQNHRALGDSLLVMDCFMGMNLHEHIQSTLIPKYI